jgi:hypothetical protein
MDLKAVNPYLKGEQDTHTPDRMLEANEVLAELGRAASAALSSGGGLEPR